MSISIRPKLQKSYTIFVYIQHFPGLRKLDSDLFKEEGATGSHSKAGWISVEENK